MKNNASSERTPSPTKQSTEKSSPKRGTKSENSNVKLPTSSYKDLKNSGKGSSTIVKQEENYLARCTNFRLTTGYEVSICNCKHIRKIRIGERHSICNPQRWLCSICLTTESVWACLSCPNVACGRFIKEHALTHFQESGHPLVIDVNELYVYCYKCDDYVLNDNNSSDVKVLRETLLAIRYQNFTGTTRSGHTLRSAMISEQEDVDMRRKMQQEQLDRDDRLFTAIWHSRFVRQRKAFRNWTRYIRRKRTQDIFSRESDEDEILSDVESAVTDTASECTAAETDKVPDSLISELPALPPSPRLALDEDMLDLAMKSSVETTMPELIELSNEPSVSTTTPIKETTRTPRDAILVVETDIEDTNLPLDTESRPVEEMEVVEPMEFMPTDAEVEETISPQMVADVAEISKFESSIIPLPEIEIIVEGDESSESETIPLEEEKQAVPVVPTALNILSRPKRSNAAARYKEIFGNLIGAVAVKREAALIPPRRISKEPLKKRRKFSEPAPSGRRSNRIKKITKEKKLTAKKKKEKPKKPKRLLKLTKGKYTRDRRTEPRKKTSSKVTKSKKQLRSKKTAKAGEKLQRARRLISAATQGRKRLNSCRPPSLYDNIPNKAVTSLIPGVTGLRNLGNTCYLNSIIQVLGHLQKFRLCLLALREIEFRETFAANSKTKGVSDAFSFSSPQARAAREMARRSTIDLYNEQNKPATLSARTSERKQSGLNGGQSPIETMAETLPLSPSRLNMRRPTSPGGGADNSTWSSSLSLCNELDHLYQVMWSGKWKLVSPYHFLHSVWNLIPSFRGYTQQDAQEFLCELLDKIVSELERCHSKSKAENNLAFRILQVVQKVFEGRLTSRVRCLECDHISSTVEPFWDLSLEFPERYHKITSKRRTSTGTRAPSASYDECTLHEMLQNFTAQETLDGGKVYGCTRCNILQQHIITTNYPGSSQQKRPLFRRNSQLLTEAEKQIKVLELPQVLRFHLKRFRWIGRNHREKIAVHVEFPSELDMRPYCCKSDNEPTKEVQYIYDLSAVVMHHGRGFGSGHYTANCWNDIGEFWVHCNDSNLELRSIDDVMTSQAYILFYTQRGLDPHPRILSPSTTPLVSSPTPSLTSPDADQEKVEMDPVDMKEDSTTT